MEGMWEVIERRAQREGERRGDRERERERTKKFGTKYCTSFISHTYSTQDMLPHTYMMHVFLAC